MGGSCRLSSPHLTIDFVSLFPPESNSFIENGCVQMGMKKKGIRLIGRNGRGRESCLLHNIVSAFSQWLSSLRSEDVPKPEAGLPHGQWWKLPLVLLLGSVNAWLEYLVYY